ncbi:MAG: alpha-ketoglutarate-dependent dioxygenase AlkB [Myxococcaceae bacterium]|nr:alpha-ketoglutarate-dependent dioxygenase AlkB [Myxococcaceae bacterium]
MRTRWPLRTTARRRTPGLHYDAGFLSEAARGEVLRWLATIHPLWENRFSEFRPLPPGETQRSLLRPVYWLGNWQFACLDYYRPPHVLDRCVEAEPFPRALRPLVDEMEQRTRGMFRDDEVPRGWRLNTCLVNFYGARREGDRWVDVARVGEHKDFEPGPVASLSLGERALFQFVTSTRPGERDGVVEQQWLDDGSLQLFGGDQWKRRTFHRVQRVDTKGGFHFAVNVADFDTRRINFTFRYVPDEHVQPYAKLSPEAQRDVLASMRELAKHSPFFARALAAAHPSPS